MDSIVWNPVSCFRKSRLSKVVLAPNMSFFWPFEWDNMDDYLEHYKVMDSMESAGIQEDEMICGYAEDDEVYFWYHEKDPPAWLRDTVNFVFRDDENVYFNSAPFRTSDD